MLLPGTSKIRFKFDVSGTTTEAELEIRHLSSGGASAPGGGYSPIDLIINSTLFLDNYDVAENHSASHSLETDTFAVPSELLVDGMNLIVLEFDASAATHVWIQWFKIDGAASP